MVDKSLSLGETPADFGILDGTVEDKPLGGGVDEVGLAADVMVLIVGEAHLRPVVVQGPDFLVVGAELAVDLVQLKASQEGAVHAQDDSEGDGGDGGADDLKTQVVCAAPAV
ncbi:hypothetical protein N7508_010118 [Penicillium antarcticum]|uniref:uncharacterized protein n=1 Tax=Penicillium antarcticum TaxID=416450 RepID=UPI00239B02C3|nr:uncharacterized protein N7508_010118 [Penicillium antarcticum]KAJ5295297.1 hypothetical protein N7508_010118 [Penicillium antarcticum]